MKTQSDLAATIAGGGLRLEESHGFVRYITPLGMVDDGYTEWYCLVFGAMTEEYDAPCFHCYGDGGAKQ